ncbi:MAG TPA: flagellar type III secretion system pore protein FliP [Candidatus Cloacimonadota bacterium]|jgi:flagellar biosynthetic protein FliP|nr:flagellar type III secretion system pore protein FliP [Candidatus Cloacimonadales bacterium]HPY96342.1 flagellar type III secretion system pore protein FliP [Candidatus Cloacimonadota bacterium]HQB40932.1 flagellar type III secretion system pore protein FliP [Candidatus Cloacimonadota bacterium]
MQIVLNNFYRLFNKKTVLLMLLVLGVCSVYAQVMPRVNIGFEPANTPKDVANSLQILFIITVISLAPSILIMMTCFTRISIVLSFTRKALGTQPVPSNQIMVSISLLLTFFIMSPIFKEINDKALQPYLRAELTHEEFYNEGISPLRTFMLKQTREKDLALMLNTSRMPKPENADDITLPILVSAYALSEIRLAFEMGFLIYLPFLMIDMIVASILMSMGMMMLPPAMISAPLKILLFIIVDGWYLIIQTLVKSINW